MKDKRRGMTLIETVICLVIIAICLVSLVRSYGNITLLSFRASEDEVMVAATEARIATLEAAPPVESEGILTGEWCYRSVVSESGYRLEVWHKTRNERYQFALREGPT